MTSLQQLHANVRLKVYEDQDHFLLLSRREDVLREIVAFVKREKGMGSRE